MIHAVNDGGIDISGSRLRKQQTPGAAIEMFLRSGAIGEAAGALEYEIDAELLPRQLLHVGDVRHRELAAIDAERFAQHLHGAWKLAMRAVVTGQVRKCVDVGQFVEGDDLECRGTVAFEIGAQHTAPNATQSIDGDAVAQSSASTVSM